MSEPEPHAEIIITAFADENIEHFSSRLIFLTWTYGIDLVGRFNDIWLYCKMGMTRDQVMEPFSRRSFDSYFGDGEWDRRRNAYRAPNGRGS